MIINIISIIILFVIFFYYIPLPAKARCRDSIAWRANDERSELRHPWEQWPAIKCNILV